MNTLFRLLMPIVALSILPAAAVAGEARTGAGSFIVAPTVALPASGCVVHTYELELAIGEDTNDWYVDVTVLAPDGRQMGGFESYVEEDWGAQSFSDDVSICGGEDDPGIYQIVGDLYTTNGDSPTYIRQALTPATFNVTGPAPTYVDVKGTVTRAPTPRGVTLTFKSTRIPASATARSPLRWSIIADGRVRSFVQKPGTTVRKSLTFPRGSGRHQVKVLRNGKVTMTITVRA